MPARRIAAALAVLAAAAVPASAQARGHVEYYRVTASFEQTSQWVSSASNDMCSDRSFTLSGDGSDRTAFKTTAVQTVAVSRQGSRLSLHYLGRKPVSFSYGPGQTYETFPMGGDETQQAHYTVSYDGPGDECLGSREIQLPDTSTCGTRQASGPYFYWKQVGDRLMLDAATFATNDPFEGSCPAQTVYATNFVEAPSAQGRVVAALLAGRSATLTGTKHTTTHDIQAIQSKQNSGTQENTVTWRASFKHLAAAGGCPSDPKHKTRPCGRRHR